MQPFNGLGVFIAVMFLCKLILSGNRYIREILLVGYSGGSGYDGVYLADVVLVAGWHSGVFYFSKLPNIKEGYCVKKCRMLCGNEVESGKMFRILVKFG